MSTNDHNNTMKTYIQQRHKEITELIERYEYQLELYKAEMTQLQPRIDALKQAEQAEREQAQKDVKVQLDSGVYVTGEQFDQIKKGEIEVIVRGKKKEKTKPEEKNEQETTDTI